MWLLDSCGASLWPPTEIVSTPLVFTPAEPPADLNSLPGIDDLEAATARRGAPVVHLLLGIAEDLRWFFWE